MLKKKPLFTVKTVEFIARTVMSQLRRILLENVSKLSGKFANLSENERKQCITIGVGLVVLTTMCMIVYLPKKSKKLYTAKLEGVVIQTSISVAVLTEILEYFADIAHTALLDTKNLQLSIEDRMDESTVDEDLPNFLYTQFGNGVRVEKEKVLDAYGYTELEIVEAVLVHKDNERIALLKDEIDLYCEKAQQLVPMSPTATTVDEPEDVPEYDEHEYNNTTGGYIRKKQDDPAAESPKVKNGFLKQIPNVITFIKLLELQYTCMGEAMNEVCCDLKTAGIPFQLWQGVGRMQEKYAAKSDQLTTESLSIYGVSLKDMRYVADHNQRDPAVQRAFNKLKEKLQIRFDELNDYYTQEVH